MGCAFAPTINFIIVDGGFIPNDLSIIGLSGACFLGIGDTAAALYGKAQGKTLWSKLSSKTTEGTFACIVAVSSVYCLLLCFHENPLLKVMMTVIVFASALAALFEGTTLQFDNLICPVVYYWAIMQMFEMVFYFD